MLTSDAIHSVRNSPVCAAAPRPTEARPRVGRAAFHLPRSPRPRAISQILQLRQAGVRRRRMVAGGLDDVAGGDPGGLHKLGGVPEPGRPRTAEVGDLGRVTRVAERFEHRAADAALRGSGPRRRRACRRSRPRPSRSACVSIGLTRVQVQDAGADAVAAELVRGGQAVVQGHAGADQRHLVAGAGPDDLGPADREFLVRPVQHRVRAAGRCACRRRRRGRPSPRTRYAALVASLGYRTVEPCTARIIARSSRRHLRRAVGADFDRRRGSRTAGCSPRRWPTSG